MMEVSYAMFLYALSVENSFYVALPLKNIVCIMTQSKTTFEKTFRKASIGNKVTIIEAGIRIAHTMIESQVCCKCKSCEQRNLSRSTILKIETVYILKVSSIRSCMKVFHSYIQI